MFARFSYAVQRASNRGFLPMAKAAGRALLASIYRKTGRQFVQRRVNDYQMLLDMNDPGISRALMMFRTREIDHKVMLERIVRPGMRIFDIGGNIGYYPLMELGLLRGTGQLIVIEPLPQNFALLKRNLALNHYTDIPMHQAALSNEATAKTFHLSTQSNLGTFHPSATGDETPTGTTLEVETLTLSLLAQRYGAPDLMRMDIEGHEVEVIGSMLDDIAKGAYAPIIIFETHPDRYGPDHDMAATLKRLFAMGYGAPLVSSSDDASTARLAAMGYSPGQRISTDAVYRTLFENIKADDAIELICHSNCIRTAMLAKQP